MNADADVDVDTKVEVAVTHRTRRVFEYSAPTLPLPKY